MFTIDSVSKVHSDEHGITIGIVGGHSDKPFSIDVWMEYDGRDMDIEREEGNVPDWLELSEAIFDNEDVSRLYSANYPG